MSKTNSNLGDVIRKRRRQLDLTQEAVAHRVNVSVAYVGHLESGKRHPSDKLIAKLADALDLDKRELFFLANPAAKVFSLKAPSLTVTLHGISSARTRVSDNSKPPPTSLLHQKIDTAPWMSVAGSHSSQSKGGIPLLR